MTIGERILNYRAMHNLSQRQMSDLLGVKEHVLYRAEAEKPMHKAREIFLNAKLDELERRK